MNVQPGESLAPLVKVVTVPLSIDEAFALFTDGLASWWPLATHSVGKHDAKSVRIEPRQGGHIVESLANRDTAHWGTVVLWQPPVGLAFTWHPGRDPSPDQQVHVSFRAIEGGTEVSLTHSGWVSLGDRAQEVRRGYDSGWDMVLGRYVVQAGG